MPPTPATPIGANHDSQEFRRDVEGLRAVAVAMVLLYHLGLQQAAGGFAGVDVFFVISGFLITRQLAGEIARTGTISLARFYSRRAKRLLPAAATVLVATGVLAFLYLPETRWPEIGGDLFAAAAYFLNWHLAARSVDYLAEDSMPSPVQHFWSLAVEEQYYIVWPVLLVLGFLATRRWLSTRGASWSVLLLIALPSFAWSVIETHTQPGPAFFSTSTRMWELAIGGAVALSAHRWQRLPLAVACCIGWLGLAAIVATLLALTPRTPWPGYAAALPVLGAAAVIVGGFNAGRGGPVAILGTRQACWLGGLSYSLYLWHWPLIAVAKEHHGGATVLRDLAVVVVSIVLAWLTRRFIEDPIRFSPAMSSRPRYALSVGVNFSLLGAIAGLVLVLAAGDGTRAVEEARSGAVIAPGARVLGEQPRNDPRGAPMDKVDWITPLPTQAARDVPGVYEDGCHRRENDDEPRACIYGNPDGAVTIAVVGDSKVAQWLPALELLAVKNDWRILVHTKSSCGFNSKQSSFHGRPYPGCHAWNRAVFERLLGPDKPDFLLTSQSRGARKGDPGMQDALLDWWRPLQASGVHIIAIANNPSPTKNVYECVAKNPAHLTACAFRRRTASSTRELRAAAARLPGTAFIDLNDAICPTRRCAPVIGNVLVYRQTSHLTRTYVETLAPRLELALAKAGVPIRKPPLRAGL